jgi:phosphatidylserine decarboxylase
LALNGGLYYAIGTHWLLYLLLVGSLILLGFLLVFFRNPVINTLQEDNLVVAPADGKIVAIEEVYEEEYFKDNRLLISIFMSPLDIHINRVPIGGLVKYVKYHSGKYLVAWHPKSSTKNERNTVVIENDYCAVMIRQVAGAVARRIVNYLKTGQKATQGKDLGFIKFGSRVDVYLPLKTALKVELEQKVKGGETVLAQVDK